jgi:hypothetical protein
MGHIDSGLNKTLKQGMLNLVEQYGHNDGYGKRPQEAEYVEQKGIGQKAAKVVGAEKIGKIL